MKQIISKSIADFRGILTLVASFWVIHVATFFVPAIKNFGIQPREIYGLIGIFTSPFLHGSLNHLIANSTSFLVLGWLFFRLENNQAIFKMIAIAILGGFGTWMIGGSHTNHIGASGVIYGMIGYLALRGFYIRSISTIAISVFIFGIYGYAVFGVLPGTPGVSWEGHLMGLLAGMFLARFHPPSKPELNR